MDISPTQRRKLKQLIAELKSKKAAHTELVTVYIPQDYDLNKINSHIAEELGTASNIKSTSTRKNVQAALEKMLQHLKLYARTPSNGLAVFSGNVAEREGQQDVRVWSIEPPMPIKTRIYRCDKDFVLDILEEMIEDKVVYGLVVIDRRDADIGLLKGKTIIPLTQAHSHVPGKFKAGGQCILPETLIETNSSTPLKELKVGDLVKSYNFETSSIEKSPITDFWIVTKNSVLEIITEDNSNITASKDHLFFIAGGQTKAGEELSTDDLLLKVSDDKITPIKIKNINKISKKTKMVDISVKNQNFIANGIIVHNSAQRFHRLIEGAAKEHYRKVAELVKEQLLGIKDLKGIIVGGPGPTKHDFIEEGQLTNELKKRIIAVKDLSYTGDFGLQELVDKSQDVLAEEEIAVEKKVMSDFFTTLAKNSEKVSYGKAEVEKALQMAAVDTLILSESLDDAAIDHYTQEAEKVGTKIVLVSTQTREGIQLRDMGGIVAMLRFAVQ